MHIPDSHAIKAFEKHLWQLILNSTNGMRAELNMMLTLLLILLNSLAAAFALAVIKMKQNQEHWLNITLSTYNQCKYLDSVTVMIHNRCFWSKVTEHNYHSILWLKFWMFFHPVMQTSSRSLPPSPGFKETARFVLPVLGHSEQLLQARHGFLHRRMRSKADSLVDEPPHGLQGQGGRLRAGLLHPLQPAGLLQPHSQAGQLRQLHVKVEADVQQALDLGDAGNFIYQDLLAVLLEVFDTIQELLKRDIDSEMEGVISILIASFKYILKHVACNNNYFFMI